MKKALSKERIDEMQESKQAQRDAYARQVIVIDKHWTIKRLDQKNWVIIKDGDEEDPWGYYGRLTHAFDALIDKVLGEGDKNALQTIHDDVAAIKRMIAAALQPAELMQAEIIVQERERANEIERRRKCK